jgi:AhpD family alkylhydroperoxidase
MKSPEQERRQTMAHEFYARIYSIGECYSILQEGIRTMPSLLSARRRSLVSRDFAERLMLAVTEVNGCEVCSWAHARMALAQGMSPEEISAMLGGDTAAVSADEATAVAFAQHYADARGRPDPAAWKRLLDAEGPARAHGVLGAVRAMMIGNAFGIAWGAFARRLAGRPVAGSTLPYELAMLVSIVVFLPVALLHAILGRVLGLPLVRFSR